MRPISCICTEENRCASQACPYDISRQNPVVCHLCASATCSGFPGKVNLRLWARRVPKLPPTDPPLWGSGLGVRTRAQCHRVDLVTDLTSTVWEEQDGVWKVCIVTPSKMHSLIWGSCQKQLMNTVFQMFQNGGLATIMIWIFFTARA